MKAGCPPAWATRVRPPPQTALVEGLAARVVAGEVPEPLLGVQVMALDMGLLMAGAPSGVALLS